MSSLYLMSFLIKDESKGGNMQTSTYKGQKNGVGGDTLNLVIKKNMSWKEGLSEVVSVEE